MISAGWVIVAVIIGWVLGVITVTRLYGAQLGGLQKDVEQSLQREEQEAKKLIALSAELQILQDRVKKFVEGNG